MKPAGIRKTGILAVMTAAVAAGLIAPAAFASELKGKFERTFTVSGPASVNVKTGSGDISVVTGDSDKVTVRGTIHVSAGWSGDSAKAQELLAKFQANPPIEQSGNTIRIGSDEDDDRYDHVSIDYALVVPKQSDFRARTGSGDLAISGPLKSVDVETGSGDADIDAVAGIVRLTTGSGDIALKEAGGAGASVRTGSGDVTISLPSEGGLNLTVETGSGDISMQRGMPIESVDTDHHRLSAKVRGGGAAFVVQTGSGDVRIH